ncbi:hypothetical protein HMPREF2826_08570 [Olsenella sp. HMSC062G07]|nr:hypothetical protein HMPREF2826_08570 [Olsenella sp. HMSC062G07]
MNQERHKLVLGLDPGIASCGFALLDCDDHKILEMGSHLFDVPQRSKDKVSLAVVRRMARSVRRNTLRTSNRQKHCLELLQGAHLVPHDADKRWFQSRKGDLPLLQLRAEGLDRKLEARELAQILYCLSGRRGYIPHGEVAKRRTGPASQEGIGQDVADVESRKVLGAIANNEKLMHMEGYRTVGEMFFKTNRSRNKKGNYDLCITNAQVQDEVRQLFEAQRSLGNDIATTELEESYLVNLSWEHKDLDYDEKVYQRVGNCTYFSGEPRAARADLSSELCNAYERFGHLVMVHADGSETRLSAAQRRKFLDILFSPVALRGNKTCKVTYAAVRKDLDLSAHDVVFKGVGLEEESKDEVYVPKAWRRLRTLLPESLMGRLLKDRELADDICESLTYASTEESLRRRLTEHYRCDLSDEELDAVMGLPFSSQLFKGYARRSRKALAMLLDAFDSDEEGTVLTLDDAEANSGLRSFRASAERTQRGSFLPPYSRYDPSCNNPVVLRAMGRMRRIVNAIIRRYGVPDEIRIELGRDLKQSKHEKDLIARANRRRKDQNQAWRESIATLKGCGQDEVRGRDLLMMSLFEEQGGKDAYTGAPIDLCRLFDAQEQRYCEIDHALPYSRTCDDSHNNKVLVLSKSNQDKRERTPYEWMTSGEPGAPDWDRYSVLVRLNKRISPRKRRYLLNMNLDEKAQEEFLSRNLNDDRYMSVAVKNFIEDSLVFPEDGLKRHVYAVTGGATAQLRRVWGLNYGPHDKKDRDDDRHHAVDACIIAACSAATIKRVANASKLGRNTLKQVRKERFAQTQPWPGFADEVRVRREFVIPTRMADHGVTGQVFKDTNYRFLGITNDKKQLAMLCGGGKELKKGNVVIGKDGNAHIIEGMAFVRLWLDPAGKKGKGKWYVEPVYYVDIPLMRQGKYVPRFAVLRLARHAWPAAPDHLLKQTPIVMWRNDVLEVDGKLGRFSGMDIMNCSLEFAPLAKGMATNIPTLGRWNKKTKVRVIEEDCLGYCYDARTMGGV